MTRWVKLERHSDWGRIYFAPPGEGITENGHASSKLGLVFGGKIHVRFPGGDCRRHTVVYKHIMSGVDDCGVAHEVWSYVPGINVQVHGLTLWVPLDEVGEVEISE